MKGAVLLSADRDLVKKFAARLLAEGVQHTTGDNDVTTQATSGLLFMFSRDRKELQSLYAMPPHLPEPGVLMPDFGQVVGYGADCRSEEYFAEMVAEVARAAASPVWVLDENDVVWDALHVDPERVRL